MRYRFIALTVGALVCAVAAPAHKSSAQDYPTKPIRMVTAFAGGGDVIIRMLAEKMSAALKQQVIVEPIPAASGSQAAGIVARAAPDGYTLLAGNSTTHIVKPLTLKGISYDPVKDFSPITMLYEPTLVIAVKADLGITDVAALVERSKKTRTLLGATGAGGNSHLMMLALNKATGSALQVVPYKDDSSLMLGLLSGDIDSTIVIGSAASRVLQDPENAKKIRVIGTFSSGPRPGFDNVRTVAEQVPGFTALPIFAAIWGPAGLPPDMVKRLNAVINEAMQDQVIRDRLTTLGSVLNVGTPEQLGNTVSTELPKVGALLKQAGIEPE